MKPYAETADPGAVRRLRRRVSALGAAPEATAAPSSPPPTQAGGKAELLVLPDIGIKGNTHMLMQDDNSLDIADILIDWIGKHVTKMD